MPSSLANLIGQIESGNNPSASLTDYAGNVSVNAQYQQSAPWVAQYGAGAAGIDNEASQMLASNPNATLGDFYSAYNHGSVLDWGTYSSRFPQQANNFLNNATAQGYDQNTPLSSLVSGASPVNNGPLGGDGPSDPNSNMFDYGSGVGSGSPDLSGTGLSSTGTGDFGDMTSGSSGDSVTVAANPTTAGNDQGTPNLGGGVSNSSGQATYTSAGGSPVTVTNTSDTGQVAGQAVQTGLNTAAKAVTTAEQSAAGTGTSWLNSIFGAEGNLLVRGGFIVVGIVVLLGAFLLLYLDGSRAPANG